MAELTLRFYDVGLVAMRTETMTVPDAGAAITLARSRLKSSRFKAASIHLDGAFLAQVGRDGLDQVSRDLCAKRWRRIDDDQAREFAISG